MKKNPLTALTLLRLGLAFVFIWFGISQLQNPSQWISFLPSWVALVPISAIGFVLINGLFEIVAGVLLALGAWTRITALLLALHLFGIAFSIGYNAIAIRDVGLAFATLALAIGGAGTFSVDTKAEEHPAPTPTPTTQ